MQERLIATFAFGALALRGQLFIETYAGRYAPVPGVVATTVSLDSTPNSTPPYPLIAADATGNLYFVPPSPGHNQIVQIDSAGFIAGTFGKLQPGFAGDGDLAMSAYFDNITAINADDAGNLFVADSGNSRIRKIDSNGIISTICGTSSSHFSGDGGPALRAGISNFITDIALAPDGNIYFADAGNARVRRIASDGTISTVAGNGSFFRTSYAVTSGDGGPALEAGVSPINIGVDSTGSLLILNRAYIQQFPTALISYEDRLRMVDPRTGIINARTLAGTPPLYRVRMDWSGRILFTSGNGLFAADKLGRVTALAGSLLQYMSGFSGDGSIATAAILRYPRDVAYDPKGNIYVSDAYNYRIRRIDAQTGIITTIAGNGLSGSSGEGGPAVSAQIGFVGSIASSPGGDRFITTSQTPSLHRVDRNTRSITTILATEQPQGQIVAGARGIIYYSDTAGHRVRKMDTVTGEVSTVAGNGSQGSSGDGSPATEAQLDSPRGLALDASGNLFIADSRRDAVRVVNLTSGLIATALDLSLLMNTRTTEAGASFVSDLLAGHPGPCSLLSLQFSGIGAIATDETQNLFVVTSPKVFDFQHGLVILRVSMPEGAVSVYAGGGTETVVTGSVPALRARITTGTMALDADGNLYYAEQDNVIRKIDPVTSMISVVAGVPYSTAPKGDGGSAAAASFTRITSLTSDGQSIYVADDQVVRRLYKPDPENLRRCLDCSGPRH